MSSLSSCSDFQRPSWNLSRYPFSRYPFSGLLSSGRSILNRMPGIPPDDALYRAGIHPERPASGLTGDETARLRDEIAASLEHSLARYGQIRREQWPGPPFGRSPWRALRPL